MCSYFVIFPHLEVSTFVKSLHSLEHVCVLAILCSISYSKMLNDLLLWCCGGIRYSFFSLSSFGRSISIWCVFQLILSCLFILVKLLSAPFKWKLSSCCLVLIHVWFAWQAIQTNTFYLWQDQIKLGATWLWKDGHSQ